MDSDSIDIDMYLPIKSSEAAIQFCDNADGLLEQRKRALMRRVYAACDESNITNFVGTVGNILFDKSYQVSHRWPSKQ